jgi:hypothetical protein
LRIPTLVIILLLAQVGWKGNQKIPVPPRAAEAMVDSMASEYYDAKLRFYPALATLKGIPGYEDRLSTYSQKSIFGMLARMRNLGRELGKLDEDSLSMAKWTEYKALLADMAAERFLLEELELWRSRPNLYVDACVEGIAALYLLKDRLSGTDLSPRLRMIPDVVKHARRNLTRPSAVPCRVASVRLQALIDMLAGLSEMAPDGGMDAGLLEDTVDTLRGFAAFLDSLSLSAGPHFALSYDDFLILSDTRNMISDSPEDVRTYAGRVLEAANKELDRLPGQSPSAGAGSLPVEELEAGLISAWDHIREEELVGLPQGPSGSGPGIMFVEMPEFGRGLFGDMMYFELPAGREPGYLTPLFVSPETAEPGLSAAGLISSEALPGRHLQAVTAKSGASPVRDLQADIFTVNGWSLYSQELMARSGFGGDGAVRDALERKRFYAAGTIAAINVFMGEFSLEAAADFMVKETGVSRAYADELALQYALEPEHPISYIIGERQIRRIREEVSRILGDDFNLKAFHNSLLASGRLPLYLLRNNVVSESVGRR